MSKAPHQRHRAVAAHPERVLDLEDQVQRFKQLLSVRAPTNTTSDGRLEWARTQKLFPSARSTRDIEVQTDALEANSELASLRLKYSVLEREKTMYQARCQTTLPSVNRIVDTRGVSVSPIRNPSSPAAAAAAAVAAPPPVLVSSNGGEKSIAALKEKCTRLIAHSTTTQARTARAVVQSKRGAALLRNEMSKIQLVLHDYRLEQEVCTQRVIETVREMSQRLASKDALFEDFRSSYVKKAELLHQEKQSLQQSVEELTVKGQNSTSLAESFITAVEKERQAQQKLSHCKDLIRIAAIRDLTLDRDRCEAELQFAKNYVNILSFSLTAVNDRCQEMQPDFVDKLTCARNKQISSLEETRREARTTLSQRSTATCILSTKALQSSETIAFKALREAQAVTGRLKDEMTRFSN